MLEVVENTMEDIKSVIGDKGFMIFLGCALIFGLYNLFKDNGSSSNDRLVPVTSISSYPDAVTNANVIIDSLNNSIDYSEGIIMDAIQGVGDDIKVTIQDAHEATNDYINKGLESNAGINMVVPPGIVSDPIINVTGSISDPVNTGSVKKPSTDSVKKPATGSSATTKKAGIQGVKYYNYKSKAGLNTSTSIVDALKAIGVDSSMDSRSKIASANGIDNYSGTYAQNVKMLGLLKSGKLKQV